MPTSGSSSWQGGGNFGIRWPGHVDPKLRLSDADRAAVADRLGTHFSDGRLDQAEFDARLEQAMSAKTHGDLAGLFADLPPEPMPEMPASAGPQKGPPRGPRARGRSPRGFLGVVLLVLLALLATRVVTNLFVPWSWGGGPWFWFSPWIWIALLAFLWLRYGPRRRGR